MESLTLTLSLFVAVLPLPLTLAVTLCGGAPPRSYSPRRCFLSFSLLLSLTTISATVTRSVYSHRVALAPYLQMVPSSPSLCYILSAFLALE
ncbi:hypothetical protein HKD37_01G002393 [Glycine soja]